MPAKSQAQQKFFGMVLAAKRGAKGMSSKVKEAAKGMSLKSAHDFASTKTKGLPVHSVMSAIKKKLKT
jgi:hypothetical protein